MAADALYPLKPLLSVHPGEWYFGVEYERLHTVLGSCVALVAWHPQLKLGGLCHYLLPASTASKRGLSNVNDCRYADNALAQMKKSMMAYGHLVDYQISIFGGGDMFAFNAPQSIGMSNIACARLWLMQEKVQVHQADVGGSISRSVVLIVATGELQVKRYAMNSQQQL